jgi:hypothetical protein
MMSYPSFSEEDFATIAERTGVSLVDPWHRSLLIDFCWEYICYSADFERGLEREDLKQDLQRKARNAKTFLKDLNDFAQASQGNATSREARLNSCRLVQFAALSDPCTHFDVRLGTGITELEFKINELIRLIENAQIYLKGRPPKKIYHFFASMAAMFEKLGGHVAANNSPVNCDRPDGPFVRFVCFIAEHLQIMSKGDLETLPDSIRYWKRHYYDLGRSAPPLLR